MMMCDAMMICMCINDMLCIMWVHVFSHEPYDVNVYVFYVVFQKQDERLTSIR